MPLCYSPNPRQQLPKWLKLHKDGAVSFAAPFAAENYALRRFADLSFVLARGDAMQEPFQVDAAYFMYRGVAAAGDIPLFREACIRHDITVIRPGSIGGEYMKTFGHYHPEIYAGGLTYPEVYEVLHGRAYFLLQSEDRATGKLNDVYIIEGKPGSKVVIPPGYGHVTINPGRDWLVTANLVCTLFEADYQPYRDKRGAAYYLMAGEKLEFTPNPCYGSALPPLRVVAPGGLEVFGVDEDLVLYDAWRRNPGAFSFLVHPEQWVDKLSSFAVLTKPW